MTQDNQWETLKNQLKQHGQDHLLAFWSELDEPHQNNLLTQIAQLDLARIDHWVDRYVKQAPSDPIPQHPEPAPSYAPIPETEELAGKYEKAIELGKTLIAQGKVGAFVVAGGQGTRLGFDGPKGNFPISPLRKKTLFQLFAEAILTNSTRHHTRCPWYIMTSPLNDSETKAVLKSNDYYGLPEDDVYIFPQGTLPNFSMDGRILLADKGKIACSPDGHGGSLKALYNSGAVNDMAQRGVEYLSYWQVDNPLIHIFDPLFIGLHAMDGADMSSKAVTKNNPLEKVGNLCLVDNKVTVIEYSDLSPEAAHQTYPDGSLVFELGSIGIHMITRRFIEKLNRGEFSLPFHRAVKKIPHIDHAGRPVVPDEPNGIKLETFVFDALPLADTSIILQTKREEEFGPVKNATGVDSAESARQMMINRAAVWLEQAGIPVPRQPDGRVDCVLEIAPSFALSAEDVKLKSNQIPTIKPGDSLYLS